MDGASEMNRPSEEPAVTPRGAMSRLSASCTGPPRRLRPRENAATLLRGARAAALALAALAVLALGVPAGAQAAVLVSNIGQADGSDGGLNFDHAQAFTTGTNTGGYSLTSVEVEFASIKVSQQQLLSAFGRNRAGDRTARVDTLSAQTFTAFSADSVTEFTKSGPIQPASTTYFVHIGLSLGLGQPSQHNVRWPRLRWAANWTIADDSRYRPVGSLMLLGQLLVSPRKSASTAPP